MEVAMSHKTTVTFIQVKDNAAKIQRFSDTVHRQFSLGKSLFISTPSLEAAIYLDELLWKMPIDSFLPHTISDDKTTAKITISIKKENLNNAEILINLCPEVSPCCHSFTKIYDLWDVTTPSKQEQSQKRREKYKELGFACYLEE